jgi:uncharacterized membrane-anchored protein YjiN (DUF445 family)
MSAIPANLERRAFDESAGLRRMRAIATGLLVLMAITFLLTRAFEAGHPALGYVRAFAEAAMIGALADWFAVVALFRHPLGLPIPHTAIIPRNKDRIGAGLGRFVETNFLAPNIVSHKLAGADLAGGFARWVQQPETLRMLSMRLSRFLPTLLDALDDEDLRKVIQMAVAGRLERIRIAPLLGEMILLMTRDGRHRPLVDELLRQASTLVERYEPSLRDKVREKTGWLWRIVGVDAKVCDRLISVAEETLADARSNPEHDWRIKLDEQLAQFAHELKTSPELQDSAEALKQELLSHPAVAEYLQGLWQDLRRFVAEDTAREDSRIRAHVQDGLQALAYRLLSDDVVRRKLNILLRTGAEQAAQAGRQAVAELIATTVAKWDADTVSRKIEVAVGRDLQFVRINGTLIGGLVGVVLHAVGALLPGTV